MPETPDNIHRFNVTALVLFDKLYNSFPAPIEIDTLDLGYHATPSDADYGTAWNYSAGADHVITWLGEEGFIRYQGANIRTSFHEVRLTLKGLTVLGFLPTAVKPTDPKEPVITKIKRVLGAGAEKAGTEAVKAVLSEVLKFAYTHGGAVAASATIISA